MFSLSSIILAFFAGILGTLIGGTQTFICTGFVGLLIFLLEHVGVNTTFLNEALSNNLFSYHIPIKCCMVSVTTVIPIQQAIPIKIGFPPLFTNFTISV